MNTAATVERERFRAQNAALQEKSAERFQKSAEAQEHHRVNGEIVVNNP